MSLIAFWHFFNDANAFGGETSDCRYAADDSERVTLSYVRRYREGRGWIGLTIVECLMDSS